VTAIKRASAASASGRSPVRKQGGLVRISSPLGSRTTKRWAGSRQWSLLGGDELREHRARKQGNEGVRSFFPGGATLLSLACSQVTNAAQASSRTGVGTMVIEHSWVEGGSVGANGHRRWEVGHACYCRCPRGIPQEGGHPANVGHRPRYWSQVGLCAAHHFSACRSGC